MTQLLAEYALKEFAPAILSYAFGFVEEKLETVKSGPWRAITPVVAEMLAAAQREVEEHGRAGVVDEHGRLLPAFRAPWEAKLLSVLVEFGFTEGV